MPKLIFTLLGKYNITTGSDDQSIQLPQLPKLLLVHFLFNRHRWHTREDITEQFWPDYTPRKAASNLTSTLTRLHQALPSEFRPLIQTCGTNTLMLSNDVDLWVDAEEFEAEASLVDTALNEDAAERLRNALGLYHGDLLPGWDEEWILIERERLRYLFVISLRRLMGFYEETGALERAVACGQRVLNSSRCTRPRMSFDADYLQTGGFAPPRSSNTKPAGACSRHSSASSRTTGSASSTARP